MVRRANQQKKGGSVMTQIATQDDIDTLINKMLKHGVIPPGFDIENKEGLVRFSTEGCLNDSGYYYLTEGVRENNSNYLMASFGCYDRGINERVCTLHERPEGEDELFYSSAHQEHLSMVEKYKALYLDEINNANHIVKADIKTDLGNQILETKQDNTCSTEIEKVDEQVVNSFIFYDGFYNALEFMPDDKTKLEYLDAIFYYGLFRETKEQTPYIEAMFALIKPQMDINFKRRKDGGKGGRPKKVKDA